MSSLLYSIGRWAFRFRLRVVGIWLILLALAGGSALVLFQGMDSSVSIPGTESQQALDELSRTFPQVSGSSAQIVIVSDDGQSLSADPYRTAITDEITAIDDIDGVDSALSPFDELGAQNLSDGGDAAVISVQLTTPTDAVSEQTKEELAEAGTALREALPDGTTVAVGGQLFSQGETGFSVKPGEIVGSLIAFLILYLVFRSFIAAAMPLIGAGIGVGITLMLIWAATALGGVSATTPALAAMLGLAVGIDYSLFIISRFRELQRAGVDPREAAARANATAGSAVIFAGITVIIALVGLSIAGIPFLTTMGIAAAVSVAFAVAIAVTLTPAFVSLLGTRLMPSAKAVARTEARAERRRRRAAGRAEGRATSGRIGFFRRWARTVTRFPIVTIVAVVAVLGALALPVLGLRLALPDASSLPAGNEARQTYDLISEHFGPGVNGPLIVTGTIVESTDPLGLMADLKSEIEAMPGVASVPLATPNETASTGIIQVIPTTGPDEQGTTDLIDAIRAKHDHFLDTYGVSLSVTGQAAVGVDISAKLSGALLPFGAFVVGLSLLLLMMVFRSIAVPIKAAVGYLLSVVAAFGVVTLVFVNGVGADLLGATSNGTVLNFLPILLMGILFGLAMDYEVFLVARMREEYVHNGHDARKAIEDGFVGSGPVVTAAGLIMFFVFAAFVPGGDSAVQAIGLGLAAGVLIDAFLVRMTLVPAIMALLGDKAWYLPKWLDRILPVVDVEGESLAHELALADWPEDGAVVAARGLRVDGPHGALFQDVDLRVPAGGVLVVQAREHQRSTALLLAIAARLTPSAGDVKVTGRVLPTHASAVRRRVGIALLAGSADPAGAVERALSGRVEVVVIDGLDTVVDPRERNAIAALIRSAYDDAARLGRPFALVLATAEASRVGDAIPHVSDETVQTVQIGFVPAHDVQEVTR
ncbi:MMPL family transporter [Herbiconiux sp. YIM B11900]|uniref:MMPL family transporter n=1 Tax=Herbiconiux sp. YIM B11900 TaxID=3404131 RepID=UPI003F858CDC